MQMIEVTPHRSFVTAMLISFTIVTAAGLGIATFVGEERDHRGFHGTADGQNRPLAHFGPYDDPLIDGVSVSLEQAKSRSRYALPIPPVTAETGERTGIWIDPSQQVAFVWGTNLRFYVNRTDLTDEDVKTEWTRKIAEEPGMWELVTVRGDLALGSSSESQSSLTFLENGLMIQFTSSAHTLEELRAFAERVHYED